LFIFDESTANLDADTAQKVLKNVEDHAKKIGAGVVYISHDRDVVNRCKSSVTLENLVKQQAAA
jgi:ABC-type lipoprotein export system ATPase subunit